jgi:hypothetical protein
MRGTVVCQLSDAATLDRRLSRRKADAMSASPEQFPTTPTQPEPDTDDEHPDAILLWIDSGDTWWEPAAGAPSDRD